MTVRITELSNGMRVATDAMPHVETVSIGIWVDVGARYESNEFNGLSHLLEHMAFKGTKTRSSRQIAEEIEAVGGYLNAYTSREHTTYFARVLKGDTDLALEILSDILQNSTFEEKELKREKEVILQEIGQALDTPDDIIFDNMQTTAYPDQALGRSILGTEERVRAFTPDNIRTYLDYHYRGQSMVLTVAGNVDHDDLVKKAEAKFSSLRSDRTRGYEAAKYKGGCHHLNKDLEQLHLTIGLPSLQFNDPDFFALQVFSTIFGGGMSSRLFQEIRENRGLAYSVYSFASSHADTGLFGIYAGTSPEMAADLVPVIADELHKMTDSISDDELSRARAQLKTGVLMSLESTTARVEQLGRQLLIFDRSIPTTELIEKIDAIDKDAVRRVLEKTLCGDITLATVGDNSHVPSFESLQVAFKG
jgi:predicted Zn-dependent peptidase